MNEEQIRALLADMLAAAGFLTKTEFNSTAAMIRGLKESVDGMKGANPLDALVTAGLLEKSADGTYTPKAPAAPTKKQDSEPEWAAEIRKLREQGEAKDKALLAEKAKREEGELKSAVIAALGAAGSVNPGRDYVHVLGSVKRAEDGSYYTVGKDEFGVESNVPLSAAFTAFLKSNPELAKAAGHAGSGTPAAATFTGSGPKDINALAAMPVDQYFAERKAGKL